MRLIISVFVIFNWNGDIGPVGAVVLDNDGLELRLLVGEGLGVLKPNVVLLQAVVVGHGAVHKVGSDVGGQTALQMRPDAVDCQVKEEIISQIKKSFSCFF